MTVGHFKEFRIVQVQKKRNTSTTTVLIDPASNCLENVMLLVTMHLVNGLQ